MTINTHPLRHPPTETTDTHPRKLPTASIHRHRPPTHPPHSSTPPTDTVHPHPPTHPHQHSPTNTGTPPTPTHRRSLTNTPTWHPRIRIPTPAPPTTNQLRLGIYGPVFFYGTIGDTISSEKTSCFHDSAKIHTQTNFLKCMLGRLLVAHFGYWCRKTLAKCRANKPKQSIVFLESFWPFTKNTQLFVSLLL